MDQYKLFKLIPNLTHEELHFIKNISDDMSDSELETFAAIYNERRRSPDTILIGTLLGFVFVAGIQRFMLNQILMGLLYLITMGLCFVGTIVDLLNYKGLTIAYNREVAVEARNMVRAL